jgi:Asp-tRNA(Asn)/Glu-tRNA(Gln) amidotransferase A subunit family amidase
MGRTVEDLALLMRAWLVQAQRDEFDFDVETHPKFDELEYASTRKLRIGFVDHDEFFPACASSRRAVREAIEVLRARGHEIVPLHTANSAGADEPYGTSLSPETDPALHPENPALPGIGDIFGLYARLIGADGQMRTMRKGIQGEALMPEYEFQYRMSSLIPDWLRPGLAWALKGFFGERYTRLGVLTPRSHTTGYQLWESVADRVAYRKRFDAVWRAHKLDALVSIGMPYPAHKHSMFSKVIAGNSWMMWANCLEYVSGAVPVSVVTEVEASEHDGYDAGRHKGDPWDKATRANLAGSAGLPVGCQILAPPGKEELVLRVMREVEDGVHFRDNHAPSGMGQGVPTARL